MVKEKRKIQDWMVRAALVPETLDENARTVEVTFGTETPYLRRTWDGNFNEVLSFDAQHIRMERLNSGAAPVLDNHDQYSGTRGVLGVVEKAWIEGKEGRALVRFSKRGEVDGVFQDVKDGILKGISVGYRVYKFEKQEVQAGPDGTQKNDVPTYRAIDWEPMEISIAPVPADYNSYVRNSSEQGFSEVEIISVNTNIMKREQIIALLEERGITVDASATDEVLLAELKRAMNPAPAPAPTPTPTPTPAPAGGEESVRAAAAAERKRISEITELCRKANIDAEQTRKYIDENISVETVRAAALEKFIAQDPNEGARGNNWVITADETDKLRKRHVDALSLRSGQVKESDFKPEEIAGAREFRSLTLLDLAKDSLERAGISTRGMDKMEIVGRAITSSSSDFPVLLEGTNRRILLAAYATVSDTWRRFCGTGSVSDFREFKRLRLGTFGRLDKVA